MILVWCVMRLQIVVALILVAFVGGAAADRGVSHWLASRKHQPQVLHIGVLVSNMDAAISEWRALGYTDIQISPPDKGISRQYHGVPLDCSLKQAFIKGQPDIELLQPLCDTPNPWASELSEKGMQLHHLAFFVPDAEEQVQKVNAAGLVEIAEGKWKDNKPGFGEFSYVRKPGDALIIEYLSHTKS